MKNSLSSLGLLLTVLFAVPTAQAKTSTEIYRDLEKINSLGSVLFIAAHPDDEDTTLLTYLSHIEKLNTAYLSLTRGDGGQNRLGPDLGIHLGITRTQELLGARKEDLGKQFLSRAVDFGYSKNVDDTAKHWEEDIVLADVVYIIRKYKPDVIITRFDPDTGGTHGHHTTSAIFARKAFALAADPKAFPEQLKELSIHQAKRIYWDAWRWGGSEIEGVDNLSFEVGLFDPLSGESISEKARRALANNKSQNTVFPSNRDKRMITLKLLDGDPAESHFMEGIQIGWSRIPGGQYIEKLLSNTLSSFDFSEPALVVPQLLEARSLILQLPDNHWKDSKLPKLEQIIADCLGLFMEARTSQESVIPGESLELSLELVNRSSSAIDFLRMEILLYDSKTWPDSEIIFEKQSSEVLQTISPFEEKIEIQIPDTASPTQPYWIETASNVPGVYNFENRRLITETDNPDALQAQLHFKVEGHSISFTIPVLHRKIDLMRGEIKAPVAIVPNVSLNFITKTVLFDSHEAKTLDLEISATHATSGKIELTSSHGWEMTYNTGIIDLEDGESAIVPISVTPLNGSGKATVEASFVTDNKTYSYESKVIRYEHIAPQFWLATASANTVDIHTVRVVSRIGYLQGAGDAVPTVLNSLGYDVDVLTVDDIANTDLSQYDAFIYGIRAYNTVSGLNRITPKLEEYVKAGGVWVVQYTVNRSFSSDFDPIYPFEITRQRVAEEDAAVKFALPEHRILNYPNKITDSDFNGWIQERGVYFGNNWDEAYQAPLSSHDKGEPSRHGGLLVAEHGEGYYIYTGFSFFRELPAGVPGAIRLFVNLISQKNTDPISSNE